jgi:uncharacterized Zn-finger protein
MGTQIMLRRVDHPGPENLPPPEVKVVDAFRVSCDGGEGALGHPRVFYTIPREQGFVDCGYCDARFVHQEYLKGTTDTAVHSYGETPALQDRAEPADIRGDVMGKQPGDGTDGPLRGNDGASGQTHSET